jgi:Etoposide-induced protein 2.4 (EI24)
MTTTNAKADTNADSTAKQHSQPWLATKALAKASLGLLNPKLWFLSLLPLLLAGLLWSAVGYFGWDAANAIVRQTISGVDVPTWLPDWLPNRSVVAPFIVLMLTFPLLLITAFIAVSLFGTGIVAQRIAKQYGLEPLQRSAMDKSASLLVGVWHSAWVLLVLGVVWLITLPAWLLAGAGMLVALVLLGWANARLFSRDVLVDFASNVERDTLLKTHRSTVWGLGLLASVPAAIPTVMWVSGALAFVALPVMALVAVWLAIMAFLATSALFSHYLLPALKYQRDAQALEAAHSGQIAAEAAASVNKIADALAIETTVTEIIEIATVAVK